MFINANSINANQETLSRSSGKHGASGRGVPRQSANDNTSSKDKLRLQARQHFKLPMLVDSSPENQLKLKFDALKEHPGASATGQLVSAGVSASLPIEIGDRSEGVVDRFESFCGPNNSGTTSQAQIEPRDQSFPASRDTTQRYEEGQTIACGVSIVRPVRSEETSYFNQNTSDSNSFSSSLVDDWIATDKRAAQTVKSSNILDTFEFNQRQLLAPVGGKLIASLPPSAARRFIRNELEIKQQLLWLKREEHELNRNVRRQHAFVATKLEERKRNLQIVQSVWSQRDFKHAMERLAELYHEGLVFASDENADDNHTRARLNSLNTSLVVDVVAILLLRPRLWTLEICQMLLPILIHDLLQSQYDYYVEVALKALRLILTHFSSIIKATLEALLVSEGAPSNIGVDLSGEDRLKKCLNCYKFLLEAHSLISAHTKMGPDHRRYTPTGPEDMERKQRRSTGSCKVSVLVRELDVMFGSLEASIGLDPNVVARQIRAGRQGEPIKGF